MISGKELRAVAECELIDLLRHRDTANFSLKIELTNGMFRVKIANLDALADTAKGTGRSFAEAWHDLTVDSLRVDSQNICGAVAEHEAEELTMASEEGAAEQAYAEKSGGTIGHPEAIRRILIPEIRELDR